MFRFLQGIKIVGNTLHLMTVASEEACFDIFGLGGLGEVGRSYQRGASVDQNDFGMLHATEGFVLCKWSWVMEEFGGDDARPAGFEKALSESISHKRHCFVG